VTYNKLVRDRIPEIIAKAGKPFEAEQMSADKYRQALRDKLVEEAQEVAMAGEEDLLTELADVYEVLEALMTAYQIGEVEVRSVQAKRCEARGGFDERLKLLWVEEMGTDQGPKN
jgi:predicted house-cleaning noncanonical NTP pyrophosphatase (MazG superfamily)